MVTVLAITAVYWLMQPSIAETLHPGEKHVIVSTRLGQLRGKEIEIFEGRRVQEFLSVPFAEPPVGEHRFRPPLIKRPWDGIRDATVLSPACYQGRDMYNSSFWGSEMWNFNTPIDEDCLYMNIWKPAANTTGLKVMVWLFGGGFYSGSPSLLLYNGSALAVQADALVVNINYRLGPFGYLYFDHEDAPGNVGMLDQQLALLWIKKHAASFGGDPSQITLFGESAGASSIVAHMIAPGSHGLFQNGILQSGSLDNNWAMVSPLHALNRSRSYARRHGCEKSDVAAMIECLRGVPAANLIDKQWDDLGFLEFPVAIVSKDKNFFKQHDAFKALRNGEYSRDVNIMIGINHDEGNFWNIYNLPEFFDKTEQPQLNYNDYKECANRAFGTLPEAYRRGAMWTYNQNCSLGCNRTKAYAEMINQMVGDFFFTCDSLWLADEYSRIGTGNIYIYYFDQPSSANPWPKWTGVMHGYEIEFVFGVPLYNKTAHYTQREVHLSEKIIEYWKTFAENGVPRLSYDTKNQHPQWPEYRQTKKWMYLKGGSKISATERRKDQECLVWRQAKDWQYNEYLRTYNSTSANTFSMSLLLAILALFYTSHS